MTEPMTPAQLRKIWRRRVQEPIETPVVRARRAYVRDYLPIFAPMLYAVELRKALRSKRLERQISDRL